jgi:hypothetical protein
MNPILTQNQYLLSTNVKIKLRVQKEYKNFTANGLNNGKPMYSWNMSGISTLTNSDAAMSEALKLINIVPNPYLAYSEYERNKVEGRVKITNLPQKCTIKIFSTSGKLIKTFKKDNPQTFLDWDMNNEAMIMASSGVYLIHVDVPGIGERVLKFFAVMRQVDIDGY